MAARRSISIWGIPLTALASLLVGTAAITVVTFLSVLFSREINPGSLSGGAAALSENLLRIIVTWPGMSFILALVGLIAGFASIPETGTDDRKRPARWISAAGIGLSLAAIFLNVLVISYLHAVASVLGPI